MEQKCKRCEVGKNVDEFAWLNSQKGIRQPYCRLCVKTHFDVKAKQHQNYSDRKKQDRIRQQQKLESVILEYLKQHSCVDCGEADPVVLEFDHLANKVNNVATLKANNTSKEVLIEEIAKCEVRCANCHRRKTAKQFGFYKTKHLCVG